MISKSYILANLKSINAGYNRAATQKEALFFSKLAVIELCGWIEESMDDIVLRSAKRSIKLNANYKFAQNKIVRPNYGFDYDRHFRKMLMSLVGLICVESIERSVDSAKLSRLQSTLGALKGIRDSEAHTHLKGITRRVNSPSWTLAQFHDVYNGLKEFESAIRKFGF